MLSMVWFSILDLLFAVSTKNNACVKAAQTDLLTQLLRSKEMNFFVLCRLSFKELIMLLKIL